MPRLSKASAAVSPPMPAPTTTIFLDVFMGDFTPCGNVLDGEPRGHCDFTPEAFTTAVQRGISAATKAAEILRRANSRLEAELFHAGDHLGGLQRRVDGGVELVHDVDGNSGRRPHPGPELKR